MTIGLRTVLLLAWCCICLFMYALARSDVSPVLVAGLSLILGFAFGDITARMDE